jgi:hypothetical protein
MDVDQHCPGAEHGQQHGQHDSQRATLQGFSPQSL